STPCAPSGCLRASRRPGEESSRPESRSCEVSCLAWYRRLAGRGFFLQTGKRVKRRSGLNSSCPAPCPRRLSAFATAAVSSRPQASCFPQRYQIYGREAVFSSPSFQWLGASGVHARGNFRSPCRGAPGWTHQPSDRLRAAGASTDLYLFRRGVPARNPATILTVGRHEVRNTE